MTGEEFFGKFNPTGNPKVEEIKQKCAEIYDLIEAEQTTSREASMLKTASQVSLLHCQVDFVKMFFLPKSDQK